MSNIAFPEIKVKIQGMDQVMIPKMGRIRQHFDDSHISDPKMTIRNELEQKIIPESVQGKRIAITVGSRGIPHNTEIVKTMVDWLKEKGAEPFIVPAMGSHGGATAEGQLELLAGYGFTKESMGVDICSTMDTVLLGNLKDGTPVYCDKFAAEADGLIIYNKIKAHTDFKGPHESGLAKMMAIGLGNHKGASLFHMMGMTTFPERLPQLAQVFLDNLPVLFGVAVAQNAYDDLCVLEVIPREKMMERERELLIYSKERMGRFLFDDIDVLIVDEIGKNISGAGLDPNVIGRNFTNSIHGVLNLKRLFIRGLSPETHGIGIGISLADVTTRRCLNSIDYTAVWENSITSTAMQSGATPMYMENDRDAIKLAIRTCNGIDFSRPRVVRIKNTLELAEFDVSEALLEDLRGDERFSVVEEPREMQFDEYGFLV